MPDHEAQVTSCAVAFVMPADRTLGELPKPRDPRVTLRLIPERLMAALVFTGNYPSTIPALRRNEVLVDLADP